MRVTTTCAVAFPSVKSYHIVAGSSEKTLAPAQLPGQRSKSIATSCAVTTAGMAYHYVLTWSLLASVIATIVAFGLIGTGRTGFGTEMTACVHTISASVNSSIC